MMFYLSLVHTDAGGYGFTIPDLPGFAAHIEGDNFGAAVQEAQAVLRDWIAAAVDQGLEIPAPSAEIDIDAHIKESSAYCVVMLTALLPAGRNVRVNLSMDEETLALADAAAEARGLSRSAYFATSAKACAFGDVPVWANSKVARLFERYPGIAPAIISDASIYQSLTFHKGEDQGDNLLIWFNAVLRDVLKGVKDPVEAEALKYRIISLLRAQSSVTETMHG